MNNIYELPLTKFARRLEVFNDSQELGEQLIKISNTSDEMLDSVEKYYILEAGENLIYLYKDCLSLLKECEKIKRGYDEC